VNAEAKRDDVAAASAQANAAGTDASSITTAAGAPHDHAAATATQAGPSDTSQLAVDASQQPQLQPVATTAIPAAQLTATAATQGAVPLSGLAVQIAATAKSGKSSFEIRLDPAELGRIDVRMNVDSQGQVTSHLTVERPETLAMLRQDAPQLQRALEDAGLKTSDSGLQFSLRDQSSSGQNNGNGSGRNAQQLIISETDPVPAAVAGRTYSRALGSSGGVDIRV
jgi:flagellar hook-length control protein FliK